MQRLLERLDEQDQRIRVLERKLELQQEASTAAVSAAPVVTASPRRFSFRSADPSSSIRPRGVLQLDGRDFLDSASSDGSNTWILRRVRPILEGTVGGLFDFRFTPDFASGRTVIQDAYVTHKFMPESTLQAGKFKTPFGLERLQSAQDIRFIKRSLANNLVPNRDIGTTYAQGVGTADKTPTIADGRRLRWSPQAYWANGSLGLLGEYVAVSQDVSRTMGAATHSARLEHRSWRLQGSWFLTGEDESFKTPTLRHPYLKGAEAGWGALEQAARVSKLRLNKDTFSGGAASFADPAANVSEATAWALGLNWYLNSNVKWSINYEQTQFDGGAASGTNRADEQAILGQVQVPGTGRI
jgi:phosphate-selective porin OprO/OprP